MVTQDAAATFAKTVGWLVAALAGALATAWGCVEAVDWAMRTLGSLPVLLVGAFFAGCVLTHAADRARQVMRDRSR